MHSLRTQVVTFVVLSAIPLVAIWAIPWFVTQDGPAHLYNANIILEHLRGSGLYEKAYVVDRGLRPNVAGHWLLAALIGIGNASIADRIMITLTSVGLAASALLLRRSVRGKFELWTVPLVLTLSLNRLWLLGFYNFLCGAISYVLTLAFWWKRRHTLSIFDALLLSIFLVIGYLCHPVSCGATITALAILTAARSISLRTKVLTAISVLPLIPLLAIYHGMLSSHGAVVPDYQRQTFAAWLQRLHRIKFLSIASTTAFPFLETDSSIALLITPSFLVAVGVLLALRFRPVPEESWKRDRRGWLFITLGLLFAAIFGPPSLGSSHGDFLRERLFALAVITASLLLDLSPTRPTTRLVPTLFALAFFIQSAFVWDYGNFSSRKVGELLKARQTIGSERFILGHVVKEETKFRASPEQHALTLLGVENGNIIWNNYEADLYYFPVKFRQPLDRCDDITMRPLHFVDIDGLSDRRTVEVRAFLCLARKNRARLDTLVVEGLGAKLDPWLPDWKPRAVSDSVRLYQ